MDATSSLDERRSGPGLRWKLSATVVASLAVASSAVPVANAADTTFTLPAGTGCAFELQVDMTGGPQVHHELTTRDGTVRVLDAGKGADLRFTNTDTGHTYELSGNGTATWRRVDAGGNLTHLTVTGHNVLIYFPSDVPAGPSTTLVVGREDIAVGPGDQFTRLSRTGRTTDICAELAPGAGP